MQKQNGIHRVLSDLENLYRTLAIESKKTNSHLKSSAEKALIKLRECRNSRKSIDDELQSELSTDIILRPLILSWSSKNISISLTALNILQKLLNVNCLSPDSFMQILISLRTLLTLHTNKYSSASSSSTSLYQSHLDINIQIKMCQILIQIPNSSSWTVSRPFLQHIIYITLLLCQSEETAVRSTSLAALQQIATVALEYSVRSKQLNQDKQVDPINRDEESSDAEPMYIFECLFHDLCCLASPDLLYLQKASVSSGSSGSSKDDSNKNEKENNDSLPNKTVVTVSDSNLNANDSNNNNALSPSNVAENESKENALSISVEQSSGNAHNAALTTSFVDNLSTLRLLDCDFATDYVPILELLETLTANEPHFALALQSSSGLVHVLHHQLCPLLCDLIEKCNSNSITFEGMMRIGRLIIELLSRHYSYLEVEADNMLTELLRLLEPSNHFPEWAPIIILEILRHLLKNSSLLKFFYIKYDMNSHSDKRVFGSLIHGLGRFLHQTTTNKAKYTQKWSPKRLDNKYFSFIKDVRNPPVDPAVQVSLGVLSLISFTEGLAVVCNVSASPADTPSTSPGGSSTFTFAQSASVVPNTPPFAMRISDDPMSPVSNEDTMALDVSMDIARHMVEVVWRPLLAALSHMLTHSIQEVQYQQLLSIYQTTSRICGRIQLLKPLESLLSSMSEHGLPHPFFNYTFSDILYNLTRDSQMIAPPSDLFTASGMEIYGGSSHSSSVSSLSSVKDNQNHLNHKQGNDAKGDRTVGNVHFVGMSDESAIKLSIKNVCTIHALVNIAHGLGSILGSAWSVLLETFEKLDYIFHRQHIQLVDIDRNIISSDSHWNDEVNMLDSRLQQLFDSSEYLNDHSLCELLAALGHLSSTSLAGLATTLDKGPASGSDASRPSRQTSISKNQNILSNDDAISVDKVKSFALRKFVQTIEVNIYRLDKIWDHVIAHLLIIMNYKSPTLRHFGIKTLIGIQLKVLSDPQRDQRNRKKPAPLPTETRNDVHKGKIPDLRVDINATTKYKNDFQKQLFEPYLKLFRSKYPDTRERVIRAVSELVENAGEYISSGWPTIVELLNYVPSAENHHAVTLSCLKLAFDSVRLIASDFLDCLPDFCILGLIKAVGLFGKQEKDNNISYSSIGLLWKISDYITLITNPKSSKDNHHDNGVVNHPQKLIDIADGLQIAIFKQLQVLCVDTRSDVRNCAMQTINSALVAYGDRMALDSWMECITVLEMLLTDVVVKRTRLNQQQDAQKREELTKREYRAFRKKWNETEKHCICGGSRICKMFVAKLAKEEQFRRYWTYYLSTIIKLLDLNPEVASTGIMCLQEICQSSDFIMCCSQDGRYWTEIIDCYEKMIRNVGHKEYEIITSRHSEWSKVSERHETNFVDQLSLPFADVVDVMMESIKDLLNPEMPSRKLFLLQQIEKLIQNLDFLISDKDLEHHFKDQPLEMLDARLVRLKKLLLIYEQLPPLAPSIAKPIISRIASYLSYVSRCCRCYHHYNSKLNVDTGPSPKINDGTPNTVKKLTKLSLSEKSLLRKTEKTMDFVSQRAITLLNQFYSIHIPHELKVECFEIVINGISTVMDPFLCPIQVVTNAIKGFEEVCKTGLPQFSAAQSKRYNEDGDTEKHDGSSSSYALSNVESLRVWSVLGDVVSIAFRLQHHTTTGGVNGSRFGMDDFEKGNNRSKNQQNLNKTLQQLVELKLSILETTMQYILPYGHFAPQTLKKRIVLLLNGNCWSDSNSSSASIQRHARLGQACITAMFDLCSDTLARKSEQKYDVELSTMSYQLLIPKVAFILDQYIDDEMSRTQNRPLPLYRQKRIVHILTELKNLQIDPALDAADSHFDRFNATTTTGGQQQVLRKRGKESNKKSTEFQSSLYCDGPLKMTGTTMHRPHLFRLYPVLCKLIRVKDEEIKNCLCDVFKTFGQEMGLNNNNT